MTCLHRTQCCCKLGRFGGRPSLGVCKTACDIGQTVQWPTVEASSTVEPKAEASKPENRTCSGCGG